MIYKRLVKRFHNSAFRRYNKLRKQVRKHFAIIRNRLNTVRGTQHLNTKLNGLRRLRWELFGLRCVLYDMEKILDDFYYMLIYLDNPENYDKIINSRYFEDDYEDEEEEDEDE